MWFCGASGVDGVREKKGSIYFGVAQCILGFVLKISCKLIVFYSTQEILRNSCACEGYSGFCSEDQFGN